MSAGRMIYLAAAAVWRARLPAMPNSGKGRYWLERDHPAGLL
jgi:hypothetical protein